MDEKELQQLFRKYVDGKCSEDEKTLLDKLFDSYVSDQEHLRFPDGNNPRIKKEMLSNIRKGIRKQQKERKKPMSRRWMGIAASFLLLIGLASGIWYYRDISSTATISYETITTPPGKRYTITLEDKTVVKLNAGSSLKFPETFRGNTRNVELTGEAFFEVARNPEKPFVIHSQGLNTTVLGTSFNIRAYPENSAVKITVATGKVRVAPEQASPGTKAAFLLPDQQAVFDKQTQQVSTQNVANASFLEWIDGTIRFDDASLSEAIAVLERWYGVKIIREGNLENCHITARFEKAELPVVLESITFAKEDLDYEFVSEKTVLLKGSCSN
ncbi:FecR domain-containing protein [Sinomicrobium kalidii]|uniref:FecR family protein n=1 Tax=Sinomicrobium kalidii TaxID=2900738 RepID=UPI001E2C175B|nr:FecR domain-containing protein [Sinomicrobium kalidii]UGU16668.1 FecR domain-containing protein [Sinomicrobium kalidii]